MVSCPLCCQIIDASHRFKFSPLVEAAIHVNCDNPTLGAVNVTGKKITTRDNKNYTIDCRSKPQ